MIATPTPPMLTPDQLRGILGIAPGEPVGNGVAFMARWQRLVLERGHGELTIRLCAGREIGWTEHVTHKEGNG